MDSFFISGLSVLGQPRLGSVYDETGTPDSGYSEDGPFHCMDCIHRLAKDLPLCIHPKVIADTCLQDRLVRLDNRPAIKVNLERGCCKFVRPSEDNDDDDRLEKTEST